MLVIDHVGVGRITVGEVGITATPPVEIHMLPRIVNAPLDDMGARAPERRGVLRAAVNVVRRLHVDRDRVELADR